MRKLLLCAAMIAGTVCMANAQEKVTFGVRAGVNVNSLSVSGESDLKSRVGYHVGAVVDWNVAKNFYVQPGLYFTTRGAKSSDEGWEQKINMNYLQIPISVAYRFPVSETVKIDVNVGPYVAFGLGGKMKISEGGYDYDDDYDYGYDYDDEYGDDEEIKMFGSEGLCKRFDAGLRFGAGVHIRKFTVGLCYDLGLTNIARESGEGAKIKNGSFQISLGYNF
ncbi:MAG: porin family protein [Alistipes sp.]|nr:porin family protein [Alistipes sp.]